MLLLTRQANARTAKKIRGNIGACRDCTENYDNEENYCEK